MLAGVYCRRCQSSRRYPIDILDIEPQCPVPDERDAVVPSVPGLPQPGARRLMWCRPTLGLLLGVVLAARTVGAQQDSIPILKVTANWQVDRFRDSDELIELTLDRTLASMETLALVIGTLDVTSLTDIAGNRVRYRPLGNALPGGDSEITVYVVRDKKWTEVAKIPIKVRNRLGLDEGRILPTIDLNSAGQLKQGGTDTTTPARPTCWPAARRWPVAP